MKHHGQEIVRQDLVRDLGDPREHRADVEDTRDRPEQLDRAFDARCVLAVDSGAARGLRKPLMGQADGDVVGQPLDQGEVVRGVSIGTAREQGEDPGHRVIDENRRRHAGPQPSLGPRHRVQNPRHDRILQHAVILAAHELGIAVTRARVQARY